MPITIIPQKDASHYHALLTPGTRHHRSLVAARPTPEDDCCSRSGTDPTQKSPAERSVGDNAQADATGPQQALGTPIDGTERGDSR